MKFYVKKQKYAGISNIKSDEIGVVLVIPEKTIIDGETYKVITFTSFILLPDVFTKIIFPDSFKRLTYFSGIKHGVTSIDLGNGIQTIPNSWFSQFPNLKEVKLSDNIVEIGRNAFSGCEKLVSIKLPNKLRIIDDYAFYACRHLNSIVFPKTLRYIGIKSFLGCTLLRNNVKFLGRPPIIKSGSFKGTHSYFRNSTNIIKIDLQYQDEYLNNESFEDFDICSDLNLCLNDNNTVDVLPLIDKDGNNCYSGDITIPNYILHGRVKYKVREIKDLSFAFCPNLKSVKLHKDIKLGNGIFIGSNCKYTKLG